MMTKTWRLKSRSIWLTSGDRNTFFYNYANQRRINNVIWEVKYSDGVQIYYYNSFEDVVVLHFKYIHKKQSSNNIEAQLKVLWNYPRFFNNEEGSNVGEIVSLEDIERILKKFSKSKSLGLDGWTIEFFLYFFDVVGKELFDDIDESRLKGHVYGSMDYRVITKMIANRIKLILTKQMTKQEFGFLSN